MKEIMYKRNLDLMVFCEDQRCEEMYDKSKEVKLEKV